MSNYPDSVDAFAPVTGTDEMTEHAERHTAEESSIVAIETTLGTNPEGDSGTVAERLDAQDTLIAGNTQAISDIVIPDTADFATKTELAEADATTLESAEAYTDTEIGKITIPDVSGFATTTELEAGDGATLDASKTYTDEEIGKIVIPETSEFATKSDLSDGLATKSETTHTHDTTHDHDADYQPVGDYATTTELSDGLAGKSDTDHTHPGGGGDAYDDTELRELVQDNTDKNEEQDLRIKALETPPIGHAHYRHGVYTNPGFAQITAGSPGNFAINKLDALGNRFISPAEGETFTYKLNDVEKSFEVTFVASTATQSVMQGEIATASKDGDIIDVEVEEVGFPEHDHTDYADIDHTHDDLVTGDHNHDGEYSKDGHVHASDDSKLDKGATTYIDAKAIQDDIDGIESSISDLSDNYDQLVIDLGNASGDLTVELEGYLKKGAASYADAAGIEAEIDQEKSDRVAADATTLASANTYTDEEVAKIVVPDVSDLATKDELTTGLAGKADEPHTHADLAAGDHNHDGDYAGKTEFDSHTHDTTHDHDADYQPVGDYATKDELSAVDEKVDANTESISKLNTSLLPLNVPVDVRAATLSTQEDANGYFASELETKLSQAPTWGELAGRP